MFKRGWVAIALAAALTAATVGSGGAVAGAQNAKIDPNGRLVFGMNMAGGGVSQRLAPPFGTSVCRFSVGAQGFRALIRGGTQTNQPGPNPGGGWGVVDPSPFTLQPPP